MSWLDDEFCELCNDQGEGQTYDVFIVCHCRTPGIARYPKVGLEVLDTVRRIKDGTYNKVKND